MFKVKIKSPCSKPPFIHPPQGVRVTTVHNRRMPKTHQLQFNIFSLPASLSFSAGLQTAFLCPFCELHTLGTWHRAVGGSTHASIPGAPSRALLRAAAGKLLL